MSPSEERRFTENGQSSQRSQADEQYRLLSYHSDVKQEVCMRGLCKKTGAVILTMMLTLSGIFAQTAGFTDDQVTVYGAQKLLYLNKSYVNIVPGNAFKLNLYFPFSLMFTSYLPAIFFIPFISFLY